jgi:putative SOS response-associated peptidase YedK
MCGRFTQLYTWSEIHAMYSLVPSTPRNIEPRYNISPTQTVGVVKKADSGDFTYSEKRWWLIPNWWKKTRKEAPSAFNARAETVAEKPMFRSHSNGAAA